MQSGHLINEGDMVCVIGSRGKIDVKARISNEVKAGVFSSTFHFPDLKIKQPTSSVSDSKAMCPEYKVVAATFVKAKGSIKMYDVNVNLSFTFAAVALAIR